MHDRDLRRGRMPHLRKGGDGAGDETTKRRIDEPWWGRNEETGAGLCFGGRKAAGAARTAFRGLTGAGIFGMYEGGKGDRPLKAM